MKPAEIIEVDEAAVACDGNAMGHPRVFLRIGEEGVVDCPYCGRRFVLRSRVPEAAS